MTTRIMRETLIILAGGKQTRWGQYSSKMLAPVLGLPLIRRTCAQLRRTGQPRPTIYSADAEVVGNERAFWPDRYQGSILEAIAATSLLWRRQTTILLGDVVFSDQAMQWLAETRVDKTKPIQIFGKTGPNEFTDKRWPEIYGLRFSLSAGNRLLECIEETLKGPCERKKIWELYRALLRLPQAREPDYWYLYHPPQSQLFAEISDWTDDIDRSVEYWNLVRRLGLLIRNASVRREAAESA